MWAIWKNRNSQLWDNTKQRPSKAPMLSLGWLQEFSKANELGLGGTRPRHHTWTKPEIGWRKCNSDGAFMAGTCRGGNGVIIRDENGHFNATAGRPFAQITSPFHAELNALTEGMKLAMMLNYGQIIFEVDCVLLVQALVQQDTDLSSLGILITEVKDIMNRHVDFKVVHVSCEANKIAHVLANHVLHSNESQSWFVVAPDYIRDVILSDCNH